MEKTVSQKGSHLRNSSETKCSISKQMFSKKKKRMQEQKSYLNVHGCMSIVLCRILRLYQSSTYQAWTLGGVAHFCHSNAHHVTHHVALQHSYSGALCAALVANIKPGVQPLWQNLGALNGLRSSCGRFKSANQKRGH